MTRQINNLRKKAGLTINDRIYIEYSTASPVLTHVIENNRAELQKAVLAKEIKKSTAVEGEKISIEGDEIMVRFKT